MQLFKCTPIFAGIDVHKKHWNVSIYVGNTHHRDLHQPPTAAYLHSYLSKMFPGGSYQSIYESGVCGFYPHRDLTRMGIQNTVVNPADIAKTDKDKKRKADKSDAKMLARALKNGDAIPIYIPSEEQEADRKLVRYRTSDLRKRLTKTKQRIKDLLTKLGKDIPEQWQGNIWSHSFVKWLKSLDDIPDSYSKVLHMLIDEYEMTKKMWQRVNREIVIMSQDPKYKSLVALLRSIPGVGLLTAMALITELIEMKRFRNLDHLCGYVGLAPNTYSSGENQRIGHLTKRANGELRRLLIQSAWVAKRKDPVLLYHFEQLTNRMCATKAITRIARKTLSRVRRVWIDQQPLQNALA